MVFALLGVEVSQLGNLVQGICYTIGRYVKALYDYGGTHLFVL